ncbi:hypothetical protein ACLKA6_005743 [Drosophila palustris]
MNKFECGRALPTEPLISNDNHSSEPALLERVRIEPCSAATTVTTAALQRIWRVRIKPCSAATTVTPAAHQRQPRVRAEPGSRLNGHHFYKFTTCSWAAATFPFVSPRVHVGSGEEDGLSGGSFFSEIQVQVEQSVAQVRDETAVTLVGAGSVVAETTWSFAPTSLTITPVFALAGLQTVRIGSVSRRSIAGSGVDEDYKELCSYYPHACSLNFGRTGSSFEQPPLPGLGADWDRVHLGRHLTAGELDGEITERRRWHSRSMDRFIQAPRQRYHGAPALPISTEPTGSSGVEPPPNSARGSEESRSTVPRNLVMGPVQPMSPIRVAAGGSGAGEKKK